MPAGEQHHALVGGVVDDVAICLAGGEVAGCSWGHVVPFQVQVSLMNGPRGVLPPPNSSSCPLAAS